MAVLPLGRERLSRILSSLFYWFHLKEEKKKQKRKKKAKTRTAARPRVAPAADLPRPREAAVPAAAKELRFGVRVSQLSGPRSRTLEVRGKSRKHAARLALEEMGAGWQILEVKLR